MAGDGHDRIVGNHVANRLHGMRGNDILDGGAGADDLRGGQGDDAYQVDQAGDRVTEKAGEGDDWVMSSAANYTLTANVERLFLTGTGNINGTGNELDNQINGNAGNNILSGGLGNDTLHGAAGGDILAAGGGDDTFIYSGASTGFDAVDGGAGTDTIQATADNTIIGLRSVSGVEAISANGFAGVVIRGSDLGPVGESLDFTGVTLTGIV
ncbi:calcium-binding protein, partial [Microvirga aerilata]|uniref:calcium-binding protein n=1 Tax=Microvirga aerilata TaxID=670292 RepID=UPI0035E4586D